MNPADNNRNNQSNSTTSWLNDECRQNVLYEYIQSLDPESLTQLSKPHPEVRQLMESHLNGVLGHLPPQHFDVSITTSRESLGQLLAAAMLNGYFLHSAHQRMSLERVLPGSFSHQEQSSEAAEEHY
ncbi:MAG: DUF760 domain-containing protein [Limnoraphis sp. WC205]|jgi:hypothetical protein|nr:DUF760 domain-containing protein [Limnoraphis sp. WC205]